MKKVRFLFLIVIILMVASSCSKAVHPTEKKLEIPSIVQPSSVEMEPETEPDPYNASMAPEDTTATPDETTSGIENQETSPATEPVEVPSESTGVAAMETQNQSQADHPQQ
ncbi:MAG: hypothetical protein ACI4EN_06850, partial [Butyrivibrio sp.]